MLVRLLGPVDVLMDGTARPMYGLRRKAVLAALALCSGQVVGADQLVSAVWDDAAPPGAATTLQSHVSHLRRILGPAAIIARPPGYVLQLSAPATDVQTARRLIHDADQSTDLSWSADQLQRAVGLWRGQAMAELAGRLWFDDHSRRLDELLLQARQALTATRLALGQHAQLIPDLEHLSRQYPMNEQARGQLMLALYRAGRQGDALVAFQRLRDTLRDELGVDPGRPLQSLHLAILRQDPILDRRDPILDRAALSGLVTTRPTPR